MKKVFLVLTLIIVSIALIGCAKKNNQKPVIEGISDGKTITIEVGDEYNPLDGVTARDDEDGDLTDKIVVTGMPEDTSNVGTFTIKLSVKDSEGLEVTISFTLTIIDPESDNLVPTITVQYTSKQIVVGNSIDDMITFFGITAFDPEDKDLTDDVTIEGEYDINTPGTYNLTAKVVDSEGAMATYPIVLIVAPKTIPDELTEEEIEITFWHAFGEEKAALIAGYAEEFTQLYPNITIEITSYGDYESLRSKVSSSIIAGTEPVMIIGYPDHVASYLGSGVVEPLDEYVNHPTYGIDISDFVQSYIDENKNYDSSGTLYGLPFNKSTEVFIYNKTFFDLHGITEFETWDDIETAAQVVRSVYNGEENETVYGFSYDSAANMFITLTKQWGGQYTDIDSNGNPQILFNNDKAKEMLQYFVTLKENNYATLPPTWEQDYASEPFKNNLVFMTVGSTAGITYNIPSDDSFELGILPIPQYDLDNKYVIQQGTNISIFNTATPQQKLAAWLFTKYLTSTEVTTDWAINTGYLPVRLSAISSERYQNFLNYDGENVTTKYLSMAANAAYQQVDYMFVDQPFIGSSKVRVQVDTLITTVIVGGVPIQEAIDTALAELEDILQ